MFPSLADLPSTLPLAWYCEKKGGKRGRGREGRRRRKASGLGQRSAESLSAEAPLPDESDRARKQPEHASALRRGGATIGVTSARNLLAMVHGWYHHHLVPHILPSTNPSTYLSVTGHDNIDMCKTTKNTTERSPSARTWRRLGPALFSPPRHIHDQSSNQNTNEVISTWEAFKGFLATQKFPPFYKFLTHCRLMMRYHTGYSPCRTHGSLLLSQGLEGKPV